MANELVDLRAKIDEEPLNAGRTDQEVLDWLLELETSEEAVDVPQTEYENWLIAEKLLGALDQAIGPSDAGSISFYMLEQYKMGAGLPMSKQLVRDTIGTDAVPTPVSAAQYTALEALAFPQVPRWLNADWTRPPILGDVVAARAL